MLKSKKLFASVIAVVFSLIMFGNFAPAQAAKRIVVKAPVVNGKIQLMQQPKAEYMPGERVAIKVKTPNITGKVEYRAVLWDNNIKATRDMWKTIYYKSWQPLGTQEFQISWPIMTPGDYRLTVYVRKVGSKASFESYASTIAFKIKQNLPAVSSYKLNISGQDEGFVTSELIDTTEKTQAEINSTVEAAVKNINPLKVNLLTGVLGKAGYDSVRFMPLGMEDAQVWAKDSAGNWYDINAVGWGPMEGFKLDANYNAVTDIYPIFADSAEYDFNFDLVDVKTEEAVISGTKTVNVDFAKSSYVIAPVITNPNFIASQLINTNDMTQEQVNNTVGEAIDENGIAPVYVVLSTAVQGASGYDAVRFAAPEVSGMQLWAQDSNGNWYDINRVGWGSMEGFELDAAYEGVTEVYPVYGQPGNRTINLNLIDVNNGSTIAAGNITVRVSGESLYTLSVEGLKSVTVSKLIDVTNKSQSDINTAVEAEKVNMTAVDVKLSTETPGIYGYKAVRFLPVNMDEVQLWAQDSNGNWIDINKDGWGSEAGFAIPSQYEGTTRVYAVFSKAGSQKVDFQLVDVNNNNFIISEKRVNVTVE